MSDVEVVIAAELVAGATAYPDADGRFVESVTGDFVVVAIDEDGRFIAVEDRVAAGCVVVAVDVDTVKNVRIEDRVAFDQAVRDQLHWALAAVVEIDLALTEVIAQDLDAAGLGKNQNVGGDVSTSKGGARRVVIIDN